MRIRTNRPRIAIRLTTAAAVALVVVVSAATPAQGAEHCSGETTRLDRGAVVSAQCWNSISDEPGERHSLWDAFCTSAAGPWQEGDAVNVVFVDNLFDPDDIANGLDPTGQYAIYDLVCQRGSTIVRIVTVIVTISPPVSTEEIRDAATARLVVPAPTPETSPPLSRQAFVGIPTWLWMDPSEWLPMEATETRGITTVRVRATPTEARWVMGGDGDGVCYGPGVAWRSGMAESDTDCAYTFKHSSYGEPDGRFEAAVTVTWAFEWWINGTYQGVFRTVDRSTQFTVAVGEIQIVETGG